MNGEAATEKTFATQINTSALQPRERRHSVKPRKIPSPSYCIFFLIVCTATVELGDGLLLHALRPYMPHVSLIFVDVLFMIVVIVPSFYFFVYRPMKLYNQERADAEAEIRFLSRQLILAADREKKAVAREIYDQFGQSLTVLQFSMETLKSSLGAEQGNQQKQCDQMIESVTRLGNLTHKFSKRLSPPQLDDLGLIPTLEWAVKDLRKKHDYLQFDLNVQTVNDILPYDIEVTIYRSFQEAINNIVKHAAATKVRIELVDSQSMVRLIVQDDGIGFEYPLTSSTRDPRQGIGLLEMRERVEELGGEISLNTALAEGTELSISIPISLRRKDDTAA